MLRATLFRLPSLVTFLTSAILGALLAYAIHEYRMGSHYLDSQLEIPHSISYSNWLHSLNVSFKPLAGNEGEETLTEAAFLNQRVRLFCFVMPYGDVSSAFGEYIKSDSPYFDVASAIMNTWGRRCNKIVFFGRAPRLKPPGVSALVVKTRALDSWSAMREAIIKIAETYKDSYDWFLNVELETYVIIENLRYYLSIFDGSRPHYFGHMYSSWDGEYNAGGAGFVLSSGALAKLHDALLKGLCEPNARSRDMMLGKCLAGVGVFPSDTRDSRGRGRFLSLDPEDHLVAQSSMWRTNYERQSKFQIKKGPECCSDYAITFHAQANTIYILEYMVYHMKPFGISAPIETVKA